MSLSKKTPSFKIRNSKFQKFILILFVNPGFAFFLVAPLLNKTFNTDKYFQHWLSSKLAHFSPMFSYSTFWKHQKNFCYLTGFWCFQVVYNRTFRSSHRRCSIKKGVLKNLTKFTGKHLFWSLFLIKLQAWAPT